MLSKFRLPTMAALALCVPSAAALAQTFAYTGALQEFDVLTTGTYDITATGAQGGAGTHAGGLGALMSGAFLLTAGEVLEIVVGGQGGSGTGTYGGTYGGGGGGGSFVYITIPSTLPLLVAGGGGGGSFTAAGTAAGTGNNGVAGTDQGLGGTDGNGGQHGPGGAPTLLGAGGGGFLTTGTSSGYAFRGAALGGNGGSGYNIGGNGGFGGGGGASNGGGGGGGYSGGGGGGNGHGGGGGGSYIDSSATVLTETAAANTGNGSVIISEEIPLAVPEPASLLLLATALVGITLARIRAVRRQRG